MPPAFQPSADSLRLSDVLGLVPVGAAGGAPLRAQICVVGGREDGGDRAMRAVVPHVVNPCGLGLSGLVGRPNRAVGVTPASQVVIIG